MELYMRSTTTSSGDGGDGVGRRERQTTMMICFVLGTDGNSKSRIQCTQKRKQRKSVSPSSSPIVPAEPTTLPPPSRRKRLRTQRAGEAAAERGQQNGGKKMEHKQTDKIRRIVIQSPSSLSAFKHIRLSRRPCDTITIS